MSQQTKIVSARIRQPKRPKPSAAESKPRLDLQFVLDVVRRWWRIAVPAGLILAAISSAIVYLTFVPQYEASVLLWIDEQEPFLVEAQKDDGKSFVSNQLGLIRSALVLDRVVAQPDVASLPDLLATGDPVDALASKINVAPAWGTEHFYIKVRSRYPEDATIIVNAVAESYNDIADAYETGRTENLISRLEEERLAAEREVEAVRDNVQKLSIDQLGQDPWSAFPEVQSSTLHPLSDLQTQLTSVKVESAMLRSEISSIEQQLSELQVSEGTVIPDPDPTQIDEAVDQSFDQDQEVAAVRQSIQTNRDRLAAIELQATDPKGHPLYDKLHDDIAADEAKLVEIRETIREGVNAQYERSVLLERNDQQGLLAAKLNELDGKLRANAARELMLTDEFNRTMGELTSLQGETLELEIKRAELDRANSVLDRIADRAFLLRTEQRAPARVRIERVASVPRFPVETVPFKMIALAALMSMAAPFALVLLWELHNRRITTPDQLESQTALSVIGEVASFPVRIGRNTRAAGRNLRLFEESVDSVRTCLVLSESIADTQVISVSSAASSEGKTTVATQLALSIARATNHRVLLIDGDMRAPDIDLVFEIDKEPGLAEVLLQECTLKEAVVANVEGSLDVLPAGHLGESPHKLFSTDAFAELIRDARRDYRYIVIDSPPVLAAGEALLIARQADATLLCTMRDVSRFEQVRKTHDRLTSSGVNVVGCVFSGVPAKKYSYRYGHYDYTY